MYQAHSLSKQQVKIILVETETPGNLGATARAMKTMGFTELRLVKPKRAESRDALARAVNAEEILLAAPHFKSLSEAIADCTLVYGTSGQIESLDQCKLTPRELASRLFSTHASLTDDIGSQDSIAIVFGRESSGLTRSELALCNAQVRIPSDPLCPSLNLASAVQIICYELSIACSADRPKILNARTRSHQEDDLATQTQLELFLSTLESLAVEIGALDPYNPRQMMTHFRRLFLRAEPRTRELNLLLNVLKRTNQRIGSRRSP